MTKSREEWNYTTNTGNGDSSNMTEAQSEGM